MISYEKFPQWVKDGLVSIKPMVAPTGKVFKMKLVSSTPEDDTPIIGSYCFFSRWSDENPNDPWYVGILEEIQGDYEEKAYYKPENFNRLFPNCRRISREEGEYILNTYPQLEGQVFDEDELKAIRYKGDE